MIKYKMKLEKLKNKEILILGFGREGKSTFNFLRKIFPQKEIAVADENSKLKIENSKLKKVKWHLGKNYLKALEKYEVIIKSPGIPVHFPEIEKAFKEKKITSQTEIFFENCKGKIVGITGTKGKSTTAFLIYKILKEGAKKVHLVGNIGKPALNYLSSDNKNKIYVYELSSHQLYKLKKSPQIALFLNIFPEHLDYYRNFKEYLMAKANITLWQKKEDFFIFNPKQKEIKEIAKKSKARKIPLKEGQELIKEVGLKKLNFPLNFYSLNLKAAISVAKIFRLKKEKIKKAIENFKGLPHRLEFVGKFKGIYFFNDSLSTIPETTISALDFFKGKVETLILGGQNRGLDFSLLSKKIIQDKIKTLIFFPETGDIIWKEILKILKKKEEMPKAFMVFKMRDAVKLAFKNTKKGKICLLSPASASFSLFKDYKERGNLFKKYVKEYGKD